MKNLSSTNIECAWSYLQLTKKLPSTKIKYSVVWK